MNKKNIIKELKFVEMNFEFSENCPIELRNYLLGHSFVNYYDDVLMLTHHGELQVGYSKQDLKDMYGDENEEVYSESLSEKENSDDW
jgi:hypothetical protein